MNLKTISMLMLVLIIGVLNFFPDKMLKTVAKEAGSIALLLGLTAFLLYLLRLLYVRVLKNKLSSLVMLSPAMQSWLKILRVLHPFVGIASVFLAAFHGYVLFSYKFHEKLAIYSGMSALLTLVALICFGLIYYTDKQKRQLRGYHFHISFLFIAVAILHKILAD